MSKLLVLIFFLTGCSTMKFKPSSKQLDIEKFMGNWYVIAGRFTSFEDGAHNAIEIYTWNEKKERIDIEFYFNKDSFKGEKKSIPQKGYIQNELNTHWKVSPFWPLKFNYLVLDFAEDYSWTAIGTGDGKFLWIMARSKKMTESDYQNALRSLKEKGYPLDKVIKVPHE